MKSGDKTGLEALLFDCDGVLVDTERDGHRIAFNEAFRRKGLLCHWDLETYGELLRVGGGKERMHHFFNQAGFPLEITDPEAMVKELHTLKTTLFMDIINSGNLPLRPGVARLMGEAIRGKVPLAVCSTSNERAVRNIIDVMLGPETGSKISVFAGDMARKKKPHPEIYDIAIKSLAVNPDRCMVVEDSRNGLLAARAAGLHCIITTSYYTVNEDFTEADAVFKDLGEEAETGVTLETLLNLLD